MHLPWSNQVSTELSLEHLPLQSGIDEVSRMQMTYCCIKNNFVDPI